MGHFSFETHCGDCGAHDKREEDFHLHLVSSWDEGGSGLPSFVAREEWSSWLRSRGLSLEQAELRGLVVRSDVVRCRDCGTLFERYRLTHSLPRGLIDWTLTSIMTGFIALISRGKRREGEPVAPHAALLGTPPALAGVLGVWAGLSFGRVSAGILAASGSLVGGSYGVTGAADLWLALRYRAQARRLASVASCPRCGSSSSKLISSFEVGQEGLVCEQCGKSSVRVTSIVDDTD